MISGAARTRTCSAIEHFFPVLKLFFTKSDLHRAAAKVIEGIGCYSIGCYCTGCYCTGCHLIGFCGTGFCGTGQIGTRAARHRDGHFLALHVVNTLKITCNYAKAG